MASEPEVAGPFRYNASTSGGHSSTLLYTGHHTAARCRTKHPPVLPRVPPGRLELAHDVRERRVLGDDRAPEDRPAV